MEEIKNTRVLVLGFDGADWELIFNWANKGKLPNFKKLIEQGVFGPLESTIPPITPPAWTSMTTGKNLGKHGIYCFIKVEKTKEDWKKSIYTSKDKKSRELWDYIEGSIVVNVPFTYPPRKIKGIMVTGMLTPSLDSEFTYPPEFKNEILKKFPNYIFELEPAQYSTRTQEFLEKLYDMTNERIRLFWYLFEKSWNLMFFVFIGPDRIQHILWETTEMEEYWKYLDNFLGEVIKRVKLEGNVILIVVSDHGFRKTNRIIYINNLLIKEKYLKPKKQVNRPNNRIAKYISRIIPYITPIYKKLPNNLKTIIKKTVRPWTSPNLFEDFDLDNSKAFFISYSGLGGLLYINRKFNPEKTKKELKKLLENLIDPETGEKVFEKIYEAEEIYPEFTFNESFEVLIVLPKEGYSTYDSILDSDIILADPKIEKANHRLYGIFFAYGPGIKKGHKIERAKIYDIAPTILHIFGLPIPNDMDGRALMEIFEQDSEFAKRRPVYVDPSYYERKQEDEKLRKAVKNLKIKGKI